MKSDNLGVWFVQILWWNLRLLRISSSWCTSMPSQHLKSNAANLCSWEWALLVDISLVYSAPLSHTLRTTWSLSSTIPREQLLVMWVFINFICLHVDDKFSSFLLCWAFIFIVMDILQAVKKLGLLGLFTRGLPLRILMIGTLTGAQWLIYDAIKVSVGL